METYKIEFWLATFLATPFLLASILTPSKAAGVVCLMIYMFWGFGALLFLVRGKRVLRREEVIKELCKKKPNFSLVRLGNFSLRDINIIMREVVKRKVLK